LQGTDKIDGNDRLDVYSFGGVTVDPRHHELRINGVIVDPGYRPSCTLHALLRAGGRLVTKDEMAAAVWPDKHRSGVADSAIEKAVSRVRLVLPEDARERIVPVRGLGWRFDFDREPHVQCQALQPVPAGLFELEPGRPVPNRNGFVLERRLGQSQGVEVWLARGTAGPAWRVFRLVIDEALLPAMREELHESDRLAALGPRRDIVRVYRRNLKKKPFFIEYEHGGDNLLVWAAGAKHLDPMGGPERLALFMQIAQAVRAAHSVGVLHRALNPGNVLLSRGPQGRWQVRLTGFGGSRLLDAPASHPPGSLLYVAPEHLHDPLAPATLASDMYALGVLLFHLLTGDFSLALHPGWDTYVYNMLLRGCIAGACHLDAARRMNVSRLIEELQALTGGHVARRAGMAAPPMRPLSSVAGAGERRSTPTANREGAAGTRPRGEQ
jgi:non-specific serine/threonine protein kinase